MEYICPKPIRWNEIHNQLYRAYERRLSIEKNNIMLPSTVSEIFKVYGLPIPLILDAWVFSNDIDKRKRWEETILWARYNELESFIFIDEKDKYYGDE